MRTAKYCFKSNLQYCIVRNCIDATSQCFGCICEILDFWWPSDAPNCLKKEVVRVMSKKEQEEDEVKKDVETQTLKSDENEDIAQTSAQNDSSDIEGNPFYPTYVQTTCLLLLIPLMILFLMKFQ